MGVKRYKTIGITGGRGFLGTHLSNELVNRGYDVVVMDNLCHASYLPLDERVEFFWGDVRNRGDCAKLVEKSDAIIHLAAEINIDKSIESPSLVWAVNTIGTLLILDQVKDTKKPLLIASSSEVYGTAQTEIQTEEHPLDGQSPYAASKIAADRLGYAYFKSYQTDVRIVRAFNICGEGQGFDSYGAVIAKFIHAIKNDEPVTIFGTGEQTRDYTHVSDTVDGYIRILEGGQPGEVYNIATGEDWSVHDLVDVIELTSGHIATRIQGPERPGEVMKLKGDASKLRALGWEPKVSFKDAIVRAWNQSI